MHMIQSGCVAAAISVINCFVAWGLKRASASGAGSGDHYSEDVHGPSAGDVFSKSALDSPRSAGPRLTPSATAKHTLLSVGIGDQGQEINTEVVKHSLALLEIFAHCSEQACKKHLLESKVLELLRRLLTIVAPGAQSSQDRRVPMAGTTMATTAVRICARLTPL